LEKGQGLPIDKDIFAIEESYSMKAKYLSKLGLDGVRQDLYVNKPMALDIQLKDCLLVLMGSYEKAEGLAL
jgi:hypothetical protein